MPADELEERVVVVGGTVPTIRLRAADQLRVVVRATRSVEGVHSAVRQFEPHETLPYRCCQIGEDLAGHTRIELQPQRGAPQRSHRDATDREILAGRIDDGRRGSREPHRGCYGVRHLDLEGRLAGICAERLVETRLLQVEGEVLERSVRLLAEEISHPTSQGARQLVGHREQVQRIVGAQARKGRHALEAVDERLLENHLAYTTLGQALRHGETRPRWYTYMSDRQPRVHRGCHVAPGREHREVVAFGRRVLDRRLIEDIDVVGDSRARDVGGSQLVESREVQVPPGPAEPDDQCFRHGATPAPSRVRSASSSGRGRSGRRRPSWMHRDPSRWMSLGDPHGMKRSGSPKVTTNGWESGAVSRTASAI